MKGTCKFLKKGAQEENRNIMVSVECRKKKIIKTYDVRFSNGQLNREVTVR